MTTKNRIFPEDKIQILYPEFINVEQTVVAIKCDSREKADELKFQLEQLNWRIFSLIESNEKHVKHSSQCIEPQNFKAHEVFEAQAEELRVLLRQCGIPEPQKTLVLIGSGEKK